jgi:hypothetical protein
MSQVAFDTLPDEARLWIFAADRALTPAERETLVRSVESGLAAWDAHGSPVRWGHKLAHDRFLMIGVDESATALIGCSIDNAVRRIREVEASLGVAMLDNGRVFYREGDTILRAARAEFGDLARAGRVTGDTIVFNNVLATVGELRQGHWEVPMKRSWHAEAFRSAAR